MNKSFNILIKVIIITAIMLPLFNYNSSNADLIALPKEQVEKNNKLYEKDIKKAQQKALREQRLQLKKAEKQKLEEQLKATKEAKKQKKLTQQKIEKGVSE